MRFENKSAGRISSRQFCSRLFGIVSSHGLFSRAATLAFLQYRSMNCSRAENAQNNRE
jgi:hypothetical protein